MEVIKFYKKYVEPFVALAVLLMLVILVIQLINYNDFQEQIADRCGWEGEDTRCFCEKSDVIAMENIAKNLFDDMNFTLID